MNRSVVFRSGRSCFPEPPSSRQNDVPGSRLLPRHHQWPSADAEGLSVHPQPHRTSPPARLLLLPDRNAAAAFMHHCLMLIPLRSSCGWTTRRFSSPLRRLFSNLKLLITVSRQKYTFFISLSFIQEENLIFDVFLFPRRYSFGSQSSQLLREARSH